MTYSRQHFFVPAFIFAGSFFYLLITVLFTNPVGNVIYVALFFMALLLAFMSLGYLLAYARHGEVGQKSKNKICIFSTLALVVVMFLSSHSLSIIDFLILVLIAFGLSFYSSRRA